MVLIALHLLRGEQIVWKSYPGKNFRLFICIRDLFLGVFCGVITYMGLAMLELGIPTSVLVGLSIAAFSLLFVFAIVNQINFLLTQYILTDERIIIRTGVLNRRLVSLKYEHVLDTNVVQSLQDRLIKTGTIYIFNANDRYDHEENPQGKAAAFRNIDQPFRVHNQLEEYLEANQIRSQTDRP